MELLNWRQKLCSATEQQFLVCKFIWKKYFTVDFYLTNIESLVRRFYPEFKVPPDDIFIEIYVKNIRGNTIVVINLAEIIRRDASLNV